MAKVEVSNIKSTSFKVRLIELQTSYAYQRKLRWTLRNLSSPASPSKQQYAYIPAYGGEGGDCTFENLTSDTEYQVLCDIYGLVNGREDALLPEALKINVSTLQSGSGGGSGGDDGDDDGGDSGGTWTLVNKGSLGTITSQKDITFTIEAYKVYRFAFQFAYSGVPKFYTTGNVATYGQWTDTSVVFSEKNGCVDPEDDITQNNGGSGNFSIGSSKFPATANTPYWLFVSGVSGSDVGTTTLHIVPPSSGEETIEKWSWTSSNGTANASLTSAAYDAVKYKQDTKNFSHLVWNDMVEKVNDVIEAYSSNADWDSSYATYNDTKMNSSPYYLTAVIFNSLRNNIEIIGNTHLKLGYLTDIGKVESGDYVEGEYFLTLAEYINDCIDKL